MVVGLAAVSAGDFAHEVEPESGAPGSASDGEPLEQARNQPGRDSGAGVTDPDVDLLVDRSAEEVDRRSPVADGVVEEVVEGLRPAAPDQRAR